MHVTAGHDTASVRRLTAILAADVAGYSRLMGADEQRTHKRSKAHLGDLVNPKIEEHRGIVKTPGTAVWRNLPAVRGAVENRPHQGAQGKAHGREDRSCPPGTELPRVR